MKPVLVVDTETAGLPGRDAHAALVEVAAVVLSPDGAELAAWSSLVYASPTLLAHHADPLPICHIPHAEILAAPPAVEVFRALGRLWLEHGKPLFCAYNHDFDKGVLAAAYGRPLAVPWGPCLMHTAHAAMIAAQERGEETGLRWLDWKNDWKWPTAEEAAAWLGIPVQAPAHRALADVRTEGAILVELARRGAVPWPQPKT